MKGGGYKRVGVPYIYNSHPKVPPRGGVSTESFYYVNNFYKLLRVVVCRKTLIFWYSVFMGSLRLFQ